MKPDDGTAVVTGASRGLGRALTLELARRGFQVIAGVRDPATTAELADARLPGRITVQRLDVTRAAEFAFPHDLAILVNNAGIRLSYLPVEHLTIDEWRATFETNVFGLIELTSRAIPLLRRGGHGVICCISSTAAMTPWPFQSAYRASKGVVSSLCDSMAVELVGSGIRVLDVPLGPVETSLLADSILYRSPEAANYPQYQDLAARQTTLRDDHRTLTTTPEQAALRIVDAICDDHAPLRVACDDGADHIVTHWRASTDTNLIEQALEALAPDTTE